MRLAVLDLGSNSFNVVVVEVSSDRSFQTITRAKVVLRLGEAVAVSGTFSEEDVARSVAAAVQLKAIADAAAASEVVVVATSAFRSAKNGDEVAERIATAIDVPVRILTGVEEARLTFDGIRASVLIDPGPALAIDLGGGSLEVMVGDGAGMLWSRSLDLGASRLTGEIIEHDPPTPAEVERVRQRVCDVLEPLVDEIAAFGPSMLVGSSGTIGTLARAVIAKEKGSLPPSAHQATVSLAGLEALELALVGSDVEVRASVPGVDDKRAPVIAAGFLVVTTAMDVFGFDEMTVSGWALREGAVIDAIGHLDRLELGDDPRAIRAASVHSLCRRCSFPEGHSRHVAALAVELFDRLLPVHGLAEEDRELLEHGAWLHDIGEHVAREDHERHSAYLVEHGRLRGFTPDEVAMLASLCRFHRRGAPKASFAPFGSLDTAERERVVRMVALLRLADGLDRSHTGHVTIAGVKVEDAEVTVQLDAARDLTVELFGLDRKLELFERVFGRRLEVDAAGGA